jgi:SEC-C motif
MSQARSNPGATLRGRVDNCFYNVEDKAKADGGGIQYGWTIWEDPGLLIEAEFHALWVSPRNELVDITEKTDGEKQILFLPDSNRIWQCEMIDNIRIPLVDNDYTHELIRSSEAAFKLRQKYWDPQSGVSKIPLHEVQGNPPQGVVRDSFQQAGNRHAKIGRNQPCYCGSGKKYKKRHGA